MKVSRPSPGCEQAPAAKRVCKEPTDLQKASSIIVELINKAK